MAARSLDWTITGKWNVYLFGGIGGAIHALWTERGALAEGRWAYENMPLIPILKVGVWPVLQLALLVPLSFGISSWPRQRKLS